MIDAPKVKPPSQAIIPSIALDDSKRSPPLLNGGPCMKRRGKKGGQLNFDSSAFLTICDDIT